MVNNVSNLGKTLEDVTMPSSQRVAGPALGQQDFLKIMIEQLRSQNPLEPSDNNQFFAQIVQFQTLEAMQGMQKAIQSLTEVSGLANAASLIGRTVTASVPRSNDPETGFPRPPEDVVGEVEIVTFGQQGAVVVLKDGRAIPSAYVTAVG
jgi:flagellar basal-body rod modification protein FlgD